MELYNLTQTTDMTPLFLGVAYVWVGVEQMTENPDGFRQLSEPIRLAA
jgi:hypothetical protein